MTESQINAGPSGSSSTASAAIGSGSEPGSDPIPLDEQEEVEAPRRNATTEESGMEGIATTSTSSPATGAGIGAEADMEIQMDGADIGPQLPPDTEGGLEGEADTAEDMVIEAGPSHIGKRVKVYELRDSSWHDRGTGHCKGVYDDTQDLALIIVEAEDMNEGKEGAPEGEGGFLKEELLLSSRVEKDDIYARQQDTLIVWTEPQTQLDIALSFQDPDGCEDIWSFVCDVQRHLNNLPSDADPAASSPRLSMSPPLGSSVFQTRASWQAPSLANIKEQQMFVNMQSKSQIGRDKIVDQIIHEVGLDWLKQLISVFDQAEDLESLEDIHAVSSIVHLLFTLNDNTILEYLLHDDVFIGLLGVLEYDPEIPTHKASYRQFFQDTAKYRQVIEIKDTVIQNKIHQTYRLQFLKEVVLSRVLDEGTFGILNGFIYFNQVDVVTHIQNNDAFLVELLGIFKNQSAPSTSPSTAESLADNTLLDQKKRDTVMFLHQLFTLAKPMQVMGRLALYRGLVDRGLLHVVEWAFRQREASVLHTASEILTFALEHDTNMVRGHILKEHDAGVPTLLVEIIKVQHATENSGLASHLTDNIRHLLDMPNETESVFARKEGPLADNFMTYFYEDNARLLFQPLLDIPTDENPPPRLTRPQVSLLILLVELLSFCVSHHGHRASYFILANAHSKKIIGLLRYKDKPLRHAVLRYARTCLRTGNHFIHRSYVKQGLIPPLLDLLEEEGARDNMLSSSCMDALDLVRKENIKSIINHMFENYRPRIEALGQRPYLRTFIQGLTTRWEQNNEPPPAPPHMESETSIGSASGSGWKNQAQEEDYFNASDDEDTTPKRPAKRIKPRLRDVRRTPKSGQTPPGAQATGQAQPPSPSASSPSPSKGTLSPININTTSTTNAPASGQPSLGLDYDDGSDSDSSNGAQSPRVPSGSGNVNANVNASGSGTAVTQELEEDLGDVAMRMRAKRQREEEDEEGFAGLLGRLTKTPSTKSDSGPSTSTTTPTSVSGEPVLVEKEKGKEKEKEKEKEATTPGKRLRLHLGFGKKNK